MKGFLTLCSIFLAFLNVCFPAAADEKEIADTLERVIISAEKSPIAYTGLKRLDRKELIAGTAVLGTPDVIKVLQNISGVASGMELMSGLYVHGGDGSDNLSSLTEYRCSRCHILQAFSRRSTLTSSNLLTFIKADFRRDMAANCLPSLTLRLRTALWKSSAVPSQSDLLTEG